MARVAIDIFSTGMSRSKHMRMSALVGLIGAITVVIAGMTRCTLRGNQTPPATNDALTSRPESLNNPIGYRMQSRRLLDVPEEQWCSILKALEPKRSRHGTFAPSQIAHTLRLFGTSYLLYTKDGWATSAL